MCKPINLIVVIAVVFLSACQMTAPKPETVATAEPGLNPAAEQRYSYALQLMKLNDHETALKAFEDVSKVDDSLSGPYVNRGLIYLKKAEKQKAEQAFRNAIKRNAKNVTALTQLGVLLREQKQFKEARQNYEAALQIDENYANAHLNLGILCDIYLQNKPCALEHYQAFQRQHNDEAVNNWVLDLKEQL